MKLENQVCSLKLAKKLKELGVKQDSLFYWVIYSGSYLGSHEYVIRSSEDIEKYKYLIIEKYSAYTVAELGEMLPAEIIIENIDYGLIMIKGLHNIKYILTYYNDKYKKGLMRAIGSEMEADARAKMLIYLLENKLIKGV